MGDEENGVMIDELHVTVWAPVGTSIEDQAKLAATIESWTRPLARKIAELVEDEIGGDGITFKVEVSR